MVCNREDCGFIFCSHCPKEFDRVYQMQSEISNVDLIVCGLVEGISRVFLREGGSMDGADDVL